MTSCACCQKVVSSAARFCSDCGAQLSGGTDRERELTRRIAELTVLHQVGEICSAANNEDELLERVTKSLTNGLRETNCGFVLLDPQGSCLSAHSSFFLSNADVDRSAIPLDKGVIGQVVRTGQAQRIGDVRQWAAYWRADPSTLSELCVPIHVNGDVVGVINVERSTLHAFSDYDEQLVVTIAKLTSDALTRLRAQTELRASEERYRLLMDSLPAYISYVDREERYRWVNRKYEDWYQRPRSEITGKHLRELQGDEQYQQMSPAVREVLSGRAVRYENTFPDSAGNPRIFDTQYVPHQHEGGQVVGFFVLVFEVTAERTALKMLGESERRYRQLFETCGDSIFVLDLAGQVLSANPAAVRMLGYSSAELLHLNIRDLVDQASAPRPEQRIQQLLSGTHSTFELPHRCKDGTVFPLEVVATPMQRGEITCILTINRDLTERKRTEQVLRAGFRYFNALFEQSTISVGQIDSQTGRFIRANQRYSELVGYSTEELLRLEFAAISHPHELQNIQDKLTKLKSGELSTFQMVHRLCRKDGSEIWVDLTAIPLWTPGSAADSHLVFVEDITERRRLEQSLRLAQFSIDRASDSMFWVGPQAEIIYVNDAACRTLGYARNELVGKTVPEIDPNFPADKWPAHWEELKQRGSFTFESDHTKKDGTLIHTEVTVNYLQFEGSEYNCAMMRDITERKRAEYQLRLAQFSIDRAVDPIFWVTSSSEVIDVNGAACSLLGYSRAELIGKSIHDIEPSSPPEAFAAGWESLRRNGSLTSETTYLAQDGHPINVEVTSNLIIHEQRELNCSTVRDITERLRAERNLRRSEERFSKLFYASPFSIIVASYPAGKVIDANEAFLKLFGFQREEVLGKTTGDLDIWVAPEDRAKMVQLLAGTGSARDLEIVFRTKSGALITLVMSVEIILLDGEPHSLAMSIDISDRKRAEHQSQQLRDRLAHANRVWLLGEISSGLAHELNQPLTAIHLYASAAQILAEQYADANLVDFLKKIGEQSFRAGEIIRRMRSFVRNDSSSRTRLEINGLVRDVLELLSDYVRQNKIEVDCQLSPVALFARADSIQIQQVIVNLIRNAVEAMSSIKDRPHLLLVQTQLAEKDIQVSIGDTGCGLDPAIAAKLFFPFQSTKPNGLGLGLSICRTLIEAHGGRISASPRADHGTTFTITLPATP